MTPSPTLERVAKLAHALQVEPLLLLHPEPGSPSAASVDLVAKTRPGLPLTLHEPIGGLPRPKRRQPPVSCTSSRGKRQKTPLG